MILLHQRKNGPEVNISNVIHHAKEFNQLEEFIVEDMTLKQVVQLKEMISSYFEYIN